VHLTWIPGALGGWCTDLGVRVGVVVGIGGSLFRTEIVLTRDYSQLRTRNNNDGRIWDSVSLASSEISVEFL
jgi:hypothetical protein